MVFPLWPVEPPLCPILHVCVQWGSDVLANHLISKLQVCATYYPRSRSPSSFEIEEVAEEIKMWKNAKIGFIEMDKDRDMKDGICVQITETNPIIVNQPTKEWMDQNTKSAIIVMFKNH